MIDNKEVDTKTEDNTSVDNSQGNTGRTPVPDDDLSEIILSLDPATLTVDDVGQLGEALAVRDTLSRFSLKEQRDIAIGKFPESFGLEESFDIELEQLGFNVPADKIEVSPQFKKVLRKAAADRVEDFNNKPHKYLEDQGVELFPVSLVNVDSFKARADQIAEQESNLDENIPLLSKKEVQRVTTNLRNLDLPQLKDAMFKLESSLEGESLSRLADSLYREAPKDGTLYAGLLKAARNKPEYVSDITRGLSMQTSEDATGQALKDFKREVAVYRPLLRQSHTDGEARMVRAFALSRGLDPLEATREFYKVKEVNGINVVMNTLEYTRDEDVKDSLGSLFSKPKLFQSYTAVPDSPIYNGKMEKLDLEDMEGFTAVRTEDIRNTGRYYMVDKRGNFAMQQKGDYLVPLVLKLGDRLKDSGVE